MTTELMIQVLTIGGPVALIAFIAIYLNHKLVMRWADQVDKSYTELQKMMGEVTEALRHINGK